MLNKTAIRGCDGNVSLGLQCHGHRIRCKGLDRAK